MSDNQEMQFADPAWEPRQTREFPVEEEMPPLQMPESPVYTPMFPGLSGNQPAGEADFDYTQGYRSQTKDHPSQTKQTYQQPSQNSTQPSLRSLPSWLWVIICIAVISLLSGGPISFGNSFSFLVNLVISLLVILVIWLLASKQIRINLRGNKPLSETRTFTVGAQPTVMITNTAGSIHLRSGQEGQVSIAAEKRGYLFSQRWDRDAIIRYNQSPATNNVAADVRNWGIFGKGMVDFEVTVPPDSHLELKTNAGQIRVENVSGQIQLRSNAGTIDANQVKLSGKSSLKTNVGSIFFVGEIESAGKYNFSTEIGTISATLPASASFQLDAKTSIGTTSTNLPFANDQPLRKASGKVGPGPHPSLNIKVEIGSIDVHQL